MSKKKIEIFNLCLDLPKECNSVKYLSLIPFIILSIFKLI